MGLGQRLRVLLVCVLAGVLTQSGAALSGGLNDGASDAGASQWRFDFTPYAWATGANGTVTARGHRAGIDASVIDIVDKNDSLFALMGYFEARKGRFSLFTDVVWEDLGFPGRAQDDFQRSRSGAPLARFSGLNIAVDAKLNIKARAQVDYESTIIQSGAAFEVAKWSTTSSRTAFDILGGARYWNQSVDTTVNLAGDLIVTATGTATFDPREVARRALQKHGFTLDRKGAKLLEHAIQKRFGPGKTVTIDRSATINLDGVVARAKSGDLEWVDPFIGGRVRHEFGTNQDLTVAADVGGFGVGSDFSWQVVATYGFDINCLGTPLHTVVGYRALAVDYSEKGQFGANALDIVQHGPVMGVNLRW